MNGIIRGRGQGSKKRNARRDAALEALSTLDWDDEEEVEMLITLSDDE